MLTSLFKQIRLLRMRAVFFALRTYCRGEVLDIGGRDFFQHIVADTRISFIRWTCLELKRSATNYSDTRYQLVLGDGEHPPFPDNSFDTVVNIQVLEHTMDPNRMIVEIARVLRPGGNAIFLIPQTSALHEVPTHYYNFTRYWIEKSFKAAGLTIVEFKPLGGRWSTHASHMLHFFFEAFRYGEYSSREYKRNFWFYLLFPFMAVYALFGIFFGMLFSLGDLTEDPNNILVVATKT